MSEITESVRHAILGELCDIESRYGVRVLYACESGSRAWGFASKDSDYDVRFIYAHPREWYLSVDLEEKRDVVEVPISDALDVSGWELRKSLKLFRKSNPPLLEWLGSPIIYREEGSLAHRLRDLSKDFFYLVACRYHYLRMAQGNFRGYLKGSEVRLKKYFYVLRPVLAVNWIDSGYGVVPTQFSTLVDAIVPNGELRLAIDELLDAKMRGFESSVGARIAPISAYLKAELERLNAVKPDNARGIGDPGELNKLFREILVECWCG